jgi:hypothetical protein
VIDHNFCNSQDLIDQSEQANVIVSDRGPILEPIQEVPVDDILVEPSEDLESGRTENLGDDILASSVEQSDIQRTDVSDTLANLPQCSSDQTNVQTEQPTEVGSS